MIYGKYNIIIDKEHTNGELLEVNREIVSIFNNHATTFGTNTFKAKLRWPGVLKDYEILESKRDPWTILKSEITHDITFIEKRRVVRFRGCMLKEISIDYSEEYICTYSYDYDLTTFL